MYATEPISATEDDGDPVCDLSASLQLHRQYPVMHAVRRQQHTATAAVNYVTDSSPALSRIVVNQRVTVSNEAAELAAPAFYLACCVDLVLVDGAPLKMKQSWFLPPPRPDSGAYLGG